MSRGLFFVLDGLGKSGKTSVRRMLEKRFSPDMMVFTREPGGTPLAEEIRRMILDGEFHLDPLTHVLLFSAARRAHIEETIRPALEAGKNVITDRFDSSTYAYNIYAEGAHHLDTFFLALREEVVRKGADPFRYFILDVDPQTAYERHKATRETMEKDKFDDRPIEFFERVRRGFLEFATDHDAVVVDANRPIEVIAGDVYEQIVRILA